MVIFLNLCEFNVQRGLYRNEGDWFKSNVCEDIDEINDEKRNMEKFTFESDGEIQVDIGFQIINIILFKFLSSTWYMFPLKAYTHDPML